MGETREFTPEELGILVERDSTPRGPWLKVVKVDQEKREVTFDVVRGRDEL